MNNAKQIASVVFYSDGTMYGGHENLFITHFRNSDLNSSFKTEFLLPKESARLWREVEKLQKDGVLSSFRAIPPGSARVDQFRLWFRPRRWLAVISAIRRIKPALIVVIAGRIEACNMGIWIAKLLRIKVAAYLPVLHERAEIFGGPLDGVRDWYNQIIYNLLDGVIMVTDAQAETLRRRLKKPVFVLHNSLPDFTACKPFRPLLQRPVRIGFLGRFHQKHKNILMLPRLSVSLRERHYDHTFLLQGEGRDTAALKKVIHELGLEKTITLQEWSSNPTAFFEQIDLLILPSFYEGVPLVMQEAIAAGIPVVASDVDGMAEWLPPESRFKSNDCASATDVIVKERWADPALWNRTRARAAIECLPQNGGRILRTALSSVLKSA